MKSIILILLSIAAAHGQTMTYFYSSKVQSENIYSGIITSNNGQPLDTIWYVTSISKVKFPDFDKLVCIGWGVMDFDSIMKNNKFEMFYNHFTKNDKYMYGKKKVKK